tara:strand:- start:17 stop:865 length:849 start_codon:yes stop_codon:yes gene_type:complete
MNVLSLFDGMSCGQIALNRLGIKYENYFASEIKKAAIQVTQENYPNTIQLGDIRNLKGKDLPKIDLILAGSPCQDLSIANKERKGLLGEKSSLFYEFVRLLNETKPKYFLLENVKMKDEEEYKISKILGVFPQLFNSSLVSAQNRNRLYWFNFGRQKLNLLGDIFCDIENPKDKNILLKDIIENGFVVRDKAFCLLEGYSRPNKSSRKRFRRYKFGFSNIVFEKENLSPFFNRLLTKKEMERLQTVPEGYTKNLTWEKSASVLGDGWTVDIICHILSHADWS